jgi:hypothetical protein
MNNAYACGDIKMLPQNPEAVLLAEILVPTAYLSVICLIFSPTS